MRGARFGVKLRYANFKSVTREITVDTFTQEASAIGVWLVNA